MDFDVVVLGGGPGGYASALYGASAGLNIALVEQDTVGGTCLQRGCIPAKALLQAAEVYRTVGHAGDYGFRLPEGTTTVDWPAVNKRKSGIVTQLTKGLQGLLKRRKVTVVKGHGRLTADGAVSVDGQTLTGKAVIVCTGSVPRLLPGMELDGERVVTSDHATNSERTTLPERVAVIGGGVIGAEFASVYTDLGSTTTLLEALPHGVLPIGPDRDVADLLARALKRRGTTIHADARVGALEHTDGGLLVPFETPGGDKIEVDQVLIAIGRRALTRTPGSRRRGSGSPTAASSRSTRPRWSPRGPASTRSATASTPRASRTSRTRRLSWRSRPSSTSGRCRSTTRRCRGWSTRTRRSPGPG